jgi:hypothetical protein
MLVPIDIADCVRTTIAPIAMGEREHGYYHHHYEHAPDVLTTHNTRIVVFVKIIFNSALWSLRWSFLFVLLTGVEREPGIGCCGEGFWKNLCNAVWWWWWLKRFYYGLRRSQTLVPKWPGDLGQWGGTWSLCSFLFGCRKRQYISRWCEVMETYLVEWQLWYRCLASSKGHICAFDVVCLKVELAPQSRDVSLFYSTLPSLARSPLQISHYPPI